METKEITENTERRERTQREERESTEKREYVATLGFFAILSAMKLATLSLTIFALFFMAMPAYAEDVILPHRVIDTTTASVVDFEGLLARCSEAQVVTLGEQHDDPSTHLFELALLQGLVRWHDGKVVLSLEMFERDVQDLVNSYLSGEITEEQFLASSRPWGNYETDYRPMVEFSKEHQLPVIAANVPRPLAAMVAENGYNNVQFTEEEQGWIAPTFDAPEDAYWEAFRQTMQMPGMAQMGITDETIRVFYEAQVLKDEAMADSVANASTNNPGSIVYHVTGAFHTIDKLGTFPRIQRDLPGADVISILVLPVEDLLAPLPEDASGADYIVLVLAPPATEEPEAGMPVMPPMPPMPMPPPEQSDSDE
jgi:uncharacterized iron-regulated protein